MWSASCAGVSIWLWSYAKRYARGACVAPEVNNITRAAGVVQQRGCEMWVGACLRGDCFDCGFLRSGRRCVVVFIGAA